MRVPPKVPNPVRTPDRKTTPPLGAGEVLRLVLLEEDIERRNMAGPYRHFKQGAYWYHPRPNVARWLDGVTWGPEPAGRLKPLKKARE